MIQPTTDHYITALKDDSFTPIGDPLPIVRKAVRELLLSSPAYLKLDEHQKLQMAKAMVQVCNTAASLIKEEIDSNNELQALKEIEDKEDEGKVQSYKALAKAQSAGQEFSGIAAKRVASTTREILNAVSFPRFVTELINGVFKAIVESSQQQINSYVELLNNVAASLEGFADANFGAGRARVWLAERYPDSFEIISEESDEGWGEGWNDEETAPAQSRIRLRPGASMPADEVLRVDLGLDKNESIPRGDPERTLVPLVRRSLANQKQKMLATMVMLGMQRIVIESGRIHASMRFHIDTRSAATSDRASRFDFQHTSKGQARFGVGPWGLSASMTNTIGYVSTQKTQTTEEMNTDLDLNSSVELYFKSDYLPLEQLAGKEKVDRIKANTLNPEAEAKEAAKLRAEREKRYAETERKRQLGLDEAIKQPTPPKAPPLPKLPEQKPKKTPTPQKPPTPAMKPSPQKPPTPAMKTPPPTPQKPPTPAMKPTPQTSPTPEMKTPPPTPMSQSAGFETTPFERDINLNHKTPEVSMRGPDVVWVPSDISIVEKMLQLASVKPNELVIDLGCGDGRIVITAAKKFGARAMGYDIDPRRIKESRDNVKRHGVEHLVKIIQKDLFTVDLSQADVVTLYLLPSLNVKLIPQLEKLKQGARVISHDFNMDGVKPDKIITLSTNGSTYSKFIYLWISPIKKIPHKKAYSDLPVKEPLINKAAIFSVA